jgi:cytochrome P450/NADPH-cytochrome P450 reductase
MRASVAAGNQVTATEHERVPAEHERPAEDGPPLEIPYAVRWLVPNGERFANFPLLNDNDTQLDYYRRFGHIYAVGIPTKKWRIVVVSDPELLDEVAADEEQFGKRVEELNFFDQLQNSRGGGISVIGDGEHYERVRRVMLPWYSPKHQRTQLERMKQQARRLVGAWSELPDDQPVDARTWMERYTLEVSGRGACNYDFGLLDPDSDAACPHAFAAAVPENTKESILRVAEPRPDFTLLSGRERRAKRRRYRRQQRELFRTAEALVRGRLHTQPLGEQTDLLTRLVSTPDSETGELLDVETIRDQILMHLSNGFNGPSITGAWLAYVLATHPDVEEKLIAEIDEITGGDADYELAYDDLMRLPYMTQVIKETLRIYPPMPITLRRSLKDGMLGRYRIRKGDIIFVGTLAAQRDPRYWGPSPDVFDPDQFAMKKVVDRPRHAFIPFSVGKRQCMAQEVTFMMLRVVLFEIYRRYQLRLAPGATVAKNTVVTTKPVSVPVVRVVREQSEQFTLRDTPPSQRMRPAGARSWGEPMEIPETSPYRRLIIAYGSNFGTNKELAERFAERSRFYGYTSDVLTMNELATSPPPSNEPWLLVALTSTYTSNPPANAAAFKALLEDAPGPTEVWRNCRFLVWGLGNSQWNAFLAFPRYLHAKLTQLGATPVADFAFADVGTPSWERVHADWNDRVWPLLLELSAARVSEAAAKRLADEAAATGALTAADSNTAMALSLGGEDLAPRVLLVPEILTNAVEIDTVEVRVAACRELHARESPKRARHVEVALPPGIRYRAGDHLGIRPKNDEDKVERLARRLGAALDGLFMVPKTMNVHVVPKGVVLQVRNVLTDLVDLAGPPTQALLELLESKGASPADAEGTDTVELLDEFPSLPFNIFELLQVVHPLRPRYYSTSSSPRVHGETAAHIVVGLADRGVCSRYVHSLREGDRVTAFVDRAEGFHLQEDVEKPMIFVSAGTGFAPMRAFLWERVALRRAGTRLGEAALFNGIRSPELDYIYRDEIEQLAADGILDHVHVATSRDPGRPHEYVQDGIRRHGDLIWRLLAEGGYVYVCGGVALRDGVRAAFVDVATEHGGLPLEHAEAWLDRLETIDNRYRPDLWG